MPVRGISDGGKLRCARGRQRCLGLEDDPKVIVEESTTDSDESAGTEEMSEGSGADQWDPLTVALDGMGTEFSWGKVDKRMSANAAMGGRVLKLEASKWDMLKEWQGELRGWCAWCDRVALSNADKRRLGIPIE